ncbi:metal-sensitive transcriptional regulator [Enterococcus sp. AZ109]|uniref:metal-sensitive transcriptional regulator n=1 Tax=Enterococcus sp. AZ109 TaxID=2774634 RepID=UPI003F1FB65B
MSHLPDHQVDALVKRINRIEGQIGGIKKMIIAEKPYDEIIIQLNSTRSAMQTISKLLLEAQADHSLLNVADGGSLEDEMEKLQKVIKQYNKMN